MLEDADLKAIEISKALANSQRELRIVRGKKKSKSTTALEKVTSKFKGTMSTPGSQSMMLNWHMGKKIPGSVSPRAVHEG